MSEGCGCAGSWARWAAARSAAVDRANGVWGIWLPGFCQFVTGVYLFAALTWFGSLRDPVLYMAALAFSAYGIHWFALGWNRYQGNDVRPTGYMSVPFTIISVLGVVVFFSAGAWPVGLLFSGLTAVYVSEFFASFRIGAKSPESAGPGERALGFFHVVTGLWLMYLTFSTTLDTALHYTLPKG